MAIQWRGLSLEECVEKARGVSRQAVHSAIKNYAGDPETHSLLKAARDVLVAERKTTRFGAERIAEIDVVRERKKLRDSRYMPDECVPAKGYEDVYAVSREGRVWLRRSARWSTITVTNDLYPRVRGSGGTIYIHRLVAETFIPNPDGKRCVNHIDGDKTNNSVNNLEWATHKENTTHAILTGLWVPGAYTRGLNPGDERKGRVGAEHSNSKLTDDKVRAIREQYENGSSTAALATKYSVCKASIYKAVKRKTWKHVQILDK